MSIKFLGQHLNLRNPLQVLFNLKGNLFYMDKSLNEIFYKAFSSYSLFKFDYVIIHIHSNFSYFSNQLLTAMLLYADL